MKSSEIRLGAAVLDPVSRRLSDRQNNPIELRYQSMSVLLFLASHPGEAVSKQAIIESVWPRTHVSDDSLSQCIADIRKALSDTDKRIVETVPRVGYRLVQSPPAAISRKHWALALSALAAILLIAAGSLFFLQRAKVPEGPAIAVLPLDDLSTADHTGYLNDALSEGIIAALARSPFFKVIARNSSFQFRGNPVDVRKAGDLLGADYLVEGSQQFDGERLRVTIQLIETDTGTHILSEKYDRTLGELFEVEDEIVAKIASKLGDTVLANIAVSHGEGEVTSLLRGLQARNLSRNPTRENWQKALALEQTSLREDPASPWGYIGTSLQLLNGYFNGWIERPREDVLGEAETLARKVVDIAPDNYMSHYAMARVLTSKKDYAGGLVHYRRAADLNPSDSLVPMAMARPLLFTGQTEEAIEVLLKAQSVDPIHSKVLTAQLGWAYWQNGECDKGLNALRGTANPPVQTLPILVVLHVCADQMDEAEKVVGALLERRPNFTIAREVLNSPANWQPEGTLERWLDSLRLAGVPE